MSIASEISRLTSAKSAIAAAITNKGVVVPGAAKLDAYPGYIAQIEGGGAGGDTSIEDGLIDGTLTECSNDRVTKIRNYAFYSCSSLTTVDLPVATSVGASAFAQCYSLTTLILRNTTQVCRLLNTNAFVNCYHYYGTKHSTYNPLGLKDGYIYVPSSLIDEYKVATNWATFATQFRALEDYTVDGTTTGELDESKI